MWNKLNCFDCWTANVGSGSTSSKNTTRHSITPARCAILLFVSQSTKSKDTRTHPRTVAVDALVFCQQCKCEIVGNYTDQCLRFSQKNCNCIQSTLLDNLRVPSPQSGVSRVIHCPNTACNSVIYIRELPRLGHSALHRRPSKSKNELYQLPMPPVNPLPATACNPLTTATTQASGLDQTQHVSPATLHPQPSRPSRTIPLHLFSDEHKIAMGLNMLVPPTQSEYPDTEVYINKLIAFSDFNIDKVSILVSDCQMGPSTSNIYDDRYMPLFVSCHEPIT
jgi:hypothetical protein